MRYYHVQRLSHIAVMQQMDNMYQYLKQENNEVQLEVNTLSDVAKYLFPPDSSPGTTRRRRSINEDEPHNRTRRFIGPVPTLATGTGFILGETIKDAACKPFSIFDLCNSTEDLERKLDQVNKQQYTQQKAFQTVQGRNNEKLALFRDALRKTQESVERIMEDTHTHTFLICLYVYTLLKMLSDAIISKAPTATFFSLRNIICYK